VFLTNNNDDNNNDDDNNNNNNNKELTDSYCSDARKMNLLYGLSNYN